MDAITRRSLMALMLGTCLATACSGGDDAGGDSGHLEPVKDASAAQLVVNDVRDAVARGVVGQLTAGTSSAIFTTTVQGGTGGSATVYGYYYKTACGSGIGWYWTVNLDVTFDGFGTMGSSTNAETILNGVVNYQGYWGTCSWSTTSVYVQSDLFWGGSQPLRVDVVIDGGAWGYSDTMTFYGSGDPISSGWARPSDGNTYYF